MTTTRNQKRIARDLQELRGCSYMQALNELRKLPEGTNWKEYVMSVALQGPDDESKQAHAIDCDMDEDCTCAEKP